MDIKQILLRYGNENLNLLNELQSSSNDQVDLNDRECSGIIEESSVDNRRKNDESDSFIEIQRRIKEKYGMNNRSPSPADEVSPVNTKKRDERDYSPQLTQSISSRYEKLTGKSPTADILTSSLDELLKSLKTKFSKNEKGAQENNRSSHLQPFDTIQKLLQSHIFKKDLEGQLGGERALGKRGETENQMNDAHTFQRDNSLSRLSNHS